MRIIVNGIYSEVSTKRKYNPDNWNVSGGRLIWKSESAKEFNAYLDTLQQKVFEAKESSLKLIKNFLLKI